MCRDSEHDSEAARLPPASKYLGPDPVYNCSLGPSVARSYPGSRCQYPARNGGLFRVIQVSSRWLTVRRQSHVRTRMFPTRAVSTPTTQAVSFKFAPSESGSQAVSTPCSDARASSTSPSVPAAGSTAPPGPPGADPDPGPRLRHRIRYRV